MSTRHNTLARAAACVRKNAVLLLAGALVLALVVLIFVTTFRVYDERKARVEALEHAALVFCHSGNELRGALRDFLAQTLVPRPVPEGAPPAVAAEIEERNRESRATVERGNRSFAPLDCAALARSLDNPTRSNP